MVQPWEMYITQRKKTWYPYHLVQLLLNNRLYNHFKLHLQTIFCPHYSSLAATSEWLYEYSFRLETKPLRNSLAKQESHWKQPSAESNLIEKTAFDLAFKQLKRNVVWLPSKWLEAWSTNIPQVWVANHEWGLWTSPLHNLYQCQRSWTFLIILTACVQRPDSSGSLARQEEPVLATQIEPLEAPLTQPKSLTDAGAILSIELNGATEQTCQGS